MAVRPKETGIKQLGFDFERRDDDVPGWPYAVLKGRRVIGRAKTKRHAAVFTWAMAVQGVLTDRKIIAFMVAVMGLMKLSGEALSPKDATMRYEGAKKWQRRPRRK